MNTDTTIDANMSAAAAINAAPSDDWLAPILPALQRWATESDCAFVAARVTVPGTPMQPGAANVCVRDANGNAAVVEMDVCRHDTGHTEIFCHDDTDDGWDD